MEATNENAATLAAKLEAAGLTEHEMLILAIAVRGLASDSEGEVEGFKDVETNERLDNFGIQEHTVSSLMPRLLRAERMAPMFNTGP